MSFGRSRSSNYAVLVGPEGFENQDISQTQEGRFMAFSILFSIRSKRLTLSVETLKALKTAMPGI